MIWPGFSFITREPLRIRADEDFAAELRRDAQPDTDEAVAERQRLDDADAWAVIRDVPCPCCDQPAGVRCYPLSNDSHYERRQAFARMLQYRTRHLSE